jgi:4-amino-4-deoxy-L-arabinose transferase-like glycosyltransferase
MTDLASRLDDRRAVRWFWLLALVVLGVGYGLRDPWPADEPRFVLVAQKMLDGGDWLFPHRGHELYPDKPPLYFWVLAAAKTLLGSWRWSFLLPSLLASLATLWLVRDIATRLWNPRAGLWAAVAVLSTLQFVYQGKRAQIDPLLLLFTTLSLYGLCRHLLLGPHWRWYLAACAAAGLGVITKGVGFLPLLALLPYAAMRWRGWEGLSTPAPRGAWRWLAGGLAFVLAIATWVAPMLWFALTDGSPEHHAYLDDILYKQTATRYTDAWHHLQPAWYYLGVIAVFWLPFSLALPWLARHWAAAWRARDARVWLPLAWSLMVLAFFSASPGKRDMYILPMLPAVAIAAAPFLAQVWERRGFRRALWGFVLLMGLLFLTLGVRATFGHAEFAVRFLANRGLGAEAIWLWWMLLCVGLIMLGAAAVWRWERPGPAAAIALVAAWIGYGAVATPILDPTSSSRQLMDQARALAGPGTELGLVDWKEQNLLQATAPVTEFGFRAPREQRLRDAVAWLRAAPGRQLLVKGGEPAGCLRLDHGRARRVGVANRREWWLVGIEGVQDPCP